jgi:hypothetical protein
MIDGRFDQHFAELFAAADKDDAAPLWPIALVCLLGLAVFAGTALL